MTTQHVIPSATRRKFVPTIASSTNIVDLASHRTARQKDAVSVDKKAMIAALIREISDTLRAQHAGDVA